MVDLIVHPSGPLRGSVTVPGDKSISHRALLLGALAEGKVRVQGWLPAEDTKATLRCLANLGIAVDDVTPSDGASALHRHLIVHGGGLEGLREPPDVLDCGGSGTTMRLLAGILAGQPFTSILTGNVALRKRPMGRVVDPLRRMGATALARNGGQLPPLAILGGHLCGYDHKLAVASAQVKSAILLAGLFADGQTIVREPGPSRDHTEQMLRWFGVELEVAAQPGVVSIAGNQHLRPPTDATLTVPADFSSAAFPLVAALLVPDSQVSLCGVGTNPTRTGLVDILHAMGALLTQVTQARVDTLARIRSAIDTEPTTDLQVRACELDAVDIGGDLVVRAIDEFPIFAIAATQARGITTVRDASELRVKESDRISAVTAELRKMGANIEERPDGMLIYGPARLRGAAVESHRDHRLAMALAVAGLVADGPTLVRDAEVVNDSFPGFVETMQSLGADIRWTPS